MQHTNPARELALPSEGFAKLPAVMTATGLSRSTLYARVKTGEFPAPVKLGARAVAWPVQSVRAWIDDRVNATKAPPAQNAKSAT
jgi:prophage regulatory protein